jgi:hypothetical protein
MLLRKLTTLCLYDLAVPALRTWISRRSMMSITSFTRMGQNFNRGRCGRFVQLVNGVLKKEVKQEVGLVMTVGKQICYLP